MALPINEPSLQYKKMLPKWELIDDLLGGTEAMRRRRELWLPKEPLESANAYKIRLKRTFLFPGYEDALEAIVSKPFVKPVTHDDPIPEELAVIEEDADLEGSDLTQFTRQLFTTGANRGLVHVLVEFPVVPEARELSIADEKRLGVRPYLVNVDARDLIRWEFQRVRGRKVLTRIFIRETGVEVEDDREREVEFIREYTRRDVTLHKVLERARGITMRVEGPREHAFGRRIGEDEDGFIPLYTAYFDKTGFLTARPPLYKLAETNLEHYQVSSDTSNILRFASVGILFGAGFTEEQLQGAFAISPNGFVGTTNKDARLQYVEYGGKALDAGKHREERLERHMVDLGLEPFMTVPRMTATRDIKSDIRAVAPIKAWVRSLEQLLTQVFDAAALWRRLPLPRIVFDVFDDFSVSSHAKDDLQHLREMRKNRDLSRETYLRETKRRGVLSDTVDIEEEVQRVQDEDDGADILGIPQQKEDEDEGVLDAAS